MERAPCPFLFFFIWMWEWMARFLKDRLEIDTRMSIFFVSKIVLQYVKEMEGVIRSCHVR